MLKKLKNPYLITAGIVFFVFLLIFIVKKIFPFGENTLIYSDMHDQITAFYYHFYDVIHGSKSLFVDFSTSGGINFWGIMAYYILSPVTLILLFFSRSQIYLAVSIVVALKILISSLTCLYAIRVLFKEKLNSFISVLLAICYAFCGYNLWLWVITPWMDAMYLFPLVVVDLKKVLDLEKPTLYIVTFSLSLIFSFYVSSISLILIFLLAGIYIYCFKEKEKRKKSITALGISTFLALGNSMVIMIPSFLQILNSSRLQITFASVLNSKMGPILDKLSFFLPSVFLISITILLLLDFKKHKKFLKWYLPSLIILGLPYVIEPINKMLHFLSYAFFPNRYGYMLFFLLILGAGYYFTNSDNKDAKKIIKIISVILTILASVITIGFTKKYYLDMHTAIFKLTISGNHRLFFIYAGVSFVSILAFCFIVKFIKNSKLYKPCLIFLSSVIIICHGFLFFGLESRNEEILKPYNKAGLLYKLHQEGDFYRLKNDTLKMVTNNGMLTDFHNLDHFTSLVNGNNLRTLKQLGYKSRWTLTHSRYGTLFSDSLLANKYYLTTQKDLEEWYEPITTIDNYSLYNFKYDLSYGYFTENIDFDESEDTFSFQNRIYQAITKSDGNLFEIYDDFSLKNIEKIEKDGILGYDILDEEASNYLEKEIKISSEKVLYLEAFTSFNNNKDNVNYDSMNIYVNNKLLKSGYPTENANGSIYLGTFKDETVNIKIVLKKDVNLSYLKIGVMDAKLFIDFVEKEKVDSKISFERNHIIVDVNNEEGGLFFVPVTYEDGYSVFVNGEEKQVEAVYGNFLGVYLEEGKSHIDFKFIPKGFKLGLGISIFSLFMVMIFTKFKLYDKLINLKILSKMAEIVYTLIYILLLFFIYLVPFVCFLLSFFFIIV